MIAGLPHYISGVFIATTALTVGIWYWILGSSADQVVRSSTTKVVLGILFWLILQAILSMMGVYSLDIDSLPPKIVLFGVLPMVLAMCLMFFTSKGRYYIDSLSFKKLTYLNIVRIPVEFVLLWLYLQKQIPAILTFEGWNYDIVMGITAPLIIYFGFVKQIFNHSIILIWNVIGVLMLCLVFILAVLSSPFPLQQLAFDQPNIGLLHFPYSWLPTFIVPLVIFGHLICIRQLLRR